MARKKAPAPQPTKARPSLVVKYIELYASRVREMQRTIDEEGLANTLLQERRLASTLTDEEVSGRMFNLLKFGEMYQA